jgi:hypothetical protein
MSGRNLIAQHYTTGLCKGQAMVAETITLLREWNPGMSPVELGKQVLADGVLPKGTASRVKDIVSRVFSFRYLIDEGRPAGRLKRLVEAGASTDLLSQIFLIHTARAHPELHDFITMVYWPRYAAGAKELYRHESVDFYKHAYADGRLPNEWTEGSRTRIARYLLSTLTDFGLTGPVTGDRREIIPFSIKSGTALYLAYELHFDGLADGQIPSHRDWQLFGLEPRDVLAELNRLSGSGQLIVQNSGEILHLSWKHKTMEPFLDELAQGNI